MSIQSNINQGLSLAALLATQNPSLQEIAKKRSEIASLNKQEKAINAAIESTGKDIAAKEPYGEQLTEVKKRQFELDPTAESFKAYKETTPTRVATFEADPEEIAQERYESELKEQEVNQYLQMYRNAETKAQETLQTKQEEKRKTRRNFLDYMKDEPTSLGGTFGELDPALQKKIANQYSKSARKKIMNRKDESNG